MSHSVLKLGELPFLHIGLWGNKNWPPSMKAKNVENFQNKSSLKGCKWSRMNGPGTENPLSHSIFELGDFPLLALWGNKNWPPSIKVKKLEIYRKVRGAKGCKWSILDAPGTQNPLSHPILELGEFPFPIISPLG